PRERQPRHHLVRQVRPAGDRGHRAHQYRLGEERGRAGTGPLLSRRHPAASVLVDAVQRRAGTDPAPLVNLVDARVVRPPGGRRVRWLVLMLAVVLGGGGGGAHAFPDRSEPRVGSTLDQGPSQVQVWFDGEIEPVFSTIRVENDDKQRVHKGDGRG